MIPTWDGAVEGIGGSLTRLKRCFILHGIPERHVARQVRWSCKRFRRPARKEVFMRFAFSHYDDGTRICVWDFDQTALTTITSRTRGRWTKAAWSSDGQWIATAKQVDAQDYEHRSRGLYTARNDGSDFRCLMNDIDIEFPQWSPDGDRLLFLRTGNFDLVTICSDGSDISPVGSVSGAGNPTWIAQSQIAFTAWENGIGYGMYVTNLDGSNMVRTIDLDWTDRERPTMPGRAFWNSNRTKFAVPFPVRGGIDIYAIGGGKGNHVKHITTENDVDSVAWSPDGERLAWVSGASLRDTGLYTCNQEGSVTELIAKPVLGHPNWSPDGQYILFTTDRSEIAMFDHTKGVILEVPVGLCFDPIWSPS